MLSVYRQYLRWAALSGLVLFFIVITCDAARAGFVIQSKDSLEITLKGYSGLTEKILFKGKLPAGKKQSIDTQYHGLALLILATGQHYPLILGEHSFTLNIEDQNRLPSFHGSAENEYFYKLLSGTQVKENGFAFPLLMFKAKQLLEETYGIRTVSQLMAIKKRFHDFVGTNYLKLQYSDMLTRLIAQYFMMHEYVSYHVQGNSPVEVRRRHHDAVMNGVGNWLEILNPHIPQQEILNHCVLLYHKRSLVTLASEIIDNFQEVAFCDGIEEKSINFSPELIVREANGPKKALQELRGSKIMAFVSVNCPVSMVETIIRARRVSREKETTVIVVPVQQLSSAHLAMEKMISNGNMLFIDDEKWRIKNIPNGLKLPRFVLIEDDS